MEPVSTASTRRLFVCTPARSAAAAVAVGWAGGRCIRSDPGRDRVASVAVALPAAGCEVRC